MPDEVIIESTIEEQIEAKRARLEASEKLKQGANPNGKVTALLYKDGSDEPVIGFLREPNRTAKARIIDSIFQTGTFQAGEMALEVCLIKEESDPRILANDDFYLAACREACNTVTIAMNQLNKKK